MKGDFPQFIHTAISESNFGMLERYMNSKSKLNGTPVREATDCNGQTLLHLYCKSAASVFEGLKVLLRRIGDVNQQDVDGNTALHLCVLHGMPRAFSRAIIKHGGDAGLKNFRGEQPWNLAIANRCGACHLPNLENVGFELVYKRFTSDMVLHHCVKKSNQEALLFYLSLVDSRYWWMKNAKDADDKVPAHYVTSATMAITLYKDGASSFAYGDREGNRPYFFYHISVIKVLLELGEQISGLNDAEQNILHFSFDLERHHYLDEDFYVPGRQNVNCQNNRDRILLLVRSGKVDLNQVDVEGYSVLHAACAAQISPEIVQCLLDHGACPFNRNNSSQTILDCVCFSYDADEAGHLTVIYSILHRALVEEEEGLKSFFWVRLYSRYM